MTTITDDVSPVPGEGAVVTDQDVPEPTPKQIAAYDAGVAAYNEGRPSTSIPFPHADPDVRDLRTLWIRGWVQARTAHRYGAYPELSDPAVLRLVALGRLEQPR